MVTLELTAGETLRLTLSALLADGFSAVTVTAHLRGPSAKNIAGTVAAGTAHFTADTEGYAPGRYAVEVWGVSASAEKRILDRGECLVLASLAGTTGATDLRSDAEKTLAKIRAALAGDISDGVKGYTINNRTLERYSMGELLQLETHYAAIVAKERRLALGKSTLGPRIAVRI